MLMDRTDKKILELLQTNSQISNQELADLVALSPSSCLRRVKLLEAQGYIKKQVALLEPEHLGLHLTVIVLVGLNSHKPAIMNAFEETVRFLPEVVQCYLITGQSADYLLKIIVPDLQAYQAFLLGKLSAIHGVETVHSSFILRTINDTTALPLDYLDKGIV
ncbi:Lrp/AsnC family transcriptional regulator [Legionella sp. km535]|uniref:Lrp/AsnC family transcriptional regulator n=1 Tax=Legionella sp. km535 TaxID=2498107 RepID=UPI000F8F5F32|nr:Lrp/AsnC family transcriptional regulator [Legionella sp. km535]